MSHRHEMISDHFCVMAQSQCRWVSPGGRCEKALAPHYSSRVYDKRACTAFNDGTIVYATSAIEKVRTPA